MKPYKVMGWGPVKVLLLPGLMGTRHGFDTMLDYADLECFQYAVPDYRGYGQLQRTAGDYTLDEIAADAASALDQLGWTQAIVGGHSIGALAAQMLALARPQQVRAVVSLAGMSARGSGADEARQQRLRAAARDRALRLEMVAAGCARQYSPGFARSVVDASWLCIVPEAFAGYAADAARTDIARQVEGSALPMLVLVGERDPVNHAALARQTTLRWYPNAQMEVLAGVGHYPMQEAPAQAMTALERFAQAQFVV
jgi:pimeloyl-ACP methyl ester carboxylesterase